MDDVTQAVADAEANGATRLEAPQDVGDAIIVASVENPSGHFIGLIYNHHFVAKWARDELTSCSLRPVEITHVATICAPAPLRGPRRRSHYRCATIRERRH